MTALAAVQNARLWRRLLMVNNLLSMRNIHIRRINMASRRSDGTSTREWTTWGRGTLQRVADADAYMC